MDRIMECVPNFSEGRDSVKVEKIADCFRGKEGVVLLDYSSDKDHNRSVLTVVGEPQALKDAVFEAISTAAELIDLTVHSGQHPRMGATDVVPFIPIKNVTVDDCKEVAETLATRVWEELKIPVFFYEKNATSPTRENLANVRKGEFEGLFEKMKQPEWHADRGGDAPHPTAGAIAMGARMPLVAFNVNLDSPNLSETTATAKKVRYVGGGLRFCKAMGVELSDRGITQVSMNMTDYTKTPLYFSYELIKTESKRYGTKPVECEIIGLVPYDALYACAEYDLMCRGLTKEHIAAMSRDEILVAANNYLNIADFKFDQILEILLEKKAQ